MRVNRLAESSEIDRLTALGHRVYSGPAIEACAFGLAGCQLSSRVVADIFGPLFHYTRLEVWPLMQASGGIGRPGVGLWLTPTPLASCMVPYDLGLNAPVDLCLTIDVSMTSTLWVGRAAASGVHSNVWEGQGLEFYSPVPVPLSAVTSRQSALPCGDVR